MTATNSPDAELIRLAAAFMCLQARIDPMNERWFSGEMRPGEAEQIDAAVTALIGEQDVFSDQMLVTPAATPAGWTAKATVAHELYRRNHRDEIAEGCLDEDDALAMSLFNDMLGRAA